MRICHIYSYSAQLRLWCSGVEGVVEAIRMLDTVTKEMILEDKTEETVKVTRVCQAGT